MSLDITFDNSYARLPDRFYARQAPSPVAAPQLLALNGQLAGDLGLDPAALRSPEGVEMLSGNRMPEGADPIAQAYAGHQFGGWVPQLGDGRAVLLGEIVDPGGRRRDLQLKGAGRTPYSRMGDGRAPLGPVLREYLVSEAMHALDVPTTRALAAVLTGETVIREVPLPGAVLTRVASSHVRVGTFQFFTARGDTDGVAALTDHVIARHYPDAEDAWGLLDAVIGAQARLVAKWMGLGFIHGVMNTDNMSVSGETIDYGPCAFMDQYDPATVYSSIDRFGRYAYAEQPNVAHWNLAQFATCLLPLMGEREAAIERASDMVNDFPRRYRAEWLAVFRAKLGLAKAEDGDAELVESLLSIMAASRADFTTTFHGLADGTARERVTDMAAFDAWADTWRDRLSREDGDPAARMRAANPAVIPRNHHVQVVIEAAMEGDLDPFEALRAATADPFTPHPVYSTPPEPGQEIGATFCGT